MEACQFQRVFSVPWFKRYRLEIIKEYADAFRKVIENYRELLPGDTKRGSEPIGGWGMTQMIRNP